MVNAADVMTRKFLSVELNEPIAAVIGKMEQADARTALVFEKKKLKGIIDRDLLKNSKISSQAEAADFIVHPPEVKETEDMMRCAELMYHSYPCVIPVIRKHVVIGIVRARDILGRISDIPQIAKLTVKEVMTPNPITVKHEERIGSVINLMKEKNISRVPIVDKAGKLISVFTLTDAIMKYIRRPMEKIQGVSKSSRGAKGGFASAKGFAPKKTIALDTNIGDAASTNIVTAKPGDLLTDAIKKMFESKISDIVVTEKDKPVGIITTRDLLKAFFGIKAAEYWGIQFFGCEKLVPQQYDSMREQIAELYEKTKRVYFNDIKYFMVQLKIYEPKETKKKKYSIHLRLATPSQLFNTDVANFDLNTAVSWAIKDMEQMMQKFKEKTRDRWVGKGRRQVFGDYIHAEGELQGASKKQYKPKLVKR